MGRPPSGSIWHSAGEEEIPAGAEWLAPGERARAATFRFTKRRNDYLLGRFASKLTVATVLGLGSDPAALQRVEVRNRQDGPERGAPEVFVDGSPAPVSISITDRAGWGVCMLDPTEVRLGCDLELVEERSAAFIADYLTEREQAFVAAADSEEARWVRSNLVWSAKESVLKVLRTGLRRDTRSVEVQVSSGSGHHGWCELHARTLEGRVFAGWWRRFGAFLLTVACEEPAAPPRALVDPPGLQRATPSHSWLQAPDALRVPIDTGKLARGGAKK